MGPGATFEDDAVEGGIVGGEVAIFPGPEDVWDFLIRLMGRWEGSRNDFRPPGRLVPAFPESE